MGKQMPVELEGSDPKKIYLDLDLCVFRHTEGKGFLAIESKVSGSELENLARDCLDERANIAFTAQYLGQDGGFNEEMRLLTRERTIAILLGKERFRKAIAETDEEWKRKFAAAAEIEGNLEPCKACGAERDFNDFADPGIPDGYCHECDPAMGQPEDRYDQPGLPFTVTEELRAKADQWTQETQRRTETRIPRMTEGPID